MGVNFLDAIGFAVSNESLANGEQTSEFSVAVLDFIPIRRDFVSEEGFSHKVFVKENLSDGKALSLDDFACCEVYDSPAYIIAEGVSIELVVSVSSTITFSLIR